MKELNQKLAVIQTKLKAKKSSYNSFGKYHFRKAEDPEKRLKSFLAKRIKGAIRRAIDNNRGTMRIPEHKLNEIRKSFDLLL